MKKITDFDIENKRLLIREDLNVPISDGHISNYARIRAALPTIEYALEKNAAVILMSHLGRPTEGVFDEKYSLAPVAAQLSTLLDKPVRFEREWLSGVAINPGEVVLCENVRFNVGEKADDETLSKQMAALCDIFVMDAFATAHRAQASTHGVAKFAANACAGPLLIAEIEALSAALDEPKAPVFAIVGGSKVSTKLTVLKTLLTKVDHLIVGGGIANTFLAAKGFNVGKSLYEKDLLADAVTLLQQAEANGVAIPLPIDVVTAKEFSANAKAQIKLIEDVADDDLILDIGPQSAADLASQLDGAGTILWNGPVGVFEFDQFAAGTKALSQAIANSAAFSIAGGGDTLAAIDKFQIADRLSYISTGGGAFLEFVEGKALPGIEVLL